ncbi:MAG: hypothetical protein PWQ93_688 [Clostridiales bacterium]|nr:hypothetical protein [Clostridiales bacterium]
MPEETFLSIPFLPDGNVTLMLVDGRINKVMEYNLKQKGIRIIKTQPLPQLLPAIAYHPDMMLYPIQGDTVVVAPNISPDVVAQLKDEDFNILYGKAALCGNYPKDIAYNIARIGNNAMHNFKYTDSMTHELLQQQKLKFIDVKQGYTKCSVLVVDPNSIVTEDIGIAKVAAKNGINVLLIERGHVSLPGMNYGFIGGSGGLISKSVMAFAGDVSTHPDYNKIKNFLNEREIEIYNLDNGYIWDLGSLIPLKQCKWNKTVV